MLLDTRGTSCGPQLSSTRHVALLAVKRLHDVLVRKTAVPTFVVCRQVGPTSRLKRVVKVALTQISTEAGRGAPQAMGGHHDDPLPVAAAPQVLSRRGQHSVDCVTTVLWMGPSISRDSSDPFPFPGRRAFVNMFTNTQFTHTCSSLISEDNNAKPKLHLFLELCSSRARPALFWNYRDEDFGGSCAALSRRRRGPLQAHATSKNLSVRFAIKQPLLVFRQRHAEGDAEKKTQTIHDLKVFDMISTERNHTDDTHQNNSDEVLKYLQRDDHTDDTNNSIPSTFMSRTLHVTGTQRTSTYIAITRTEQSSCPQHHTRETRATLDNHQLAPTAPINSLHILMFPFHRNSPFVCPHCTSFALTHAFLHPHSPVVIQAFVFPPLCFKDLRQTFE